MVTKSHLEKCVIFRKTILPLIVTSFKEADIERPLIDIMGMIMRPEGINELVPDKQIRVKLKEEIALYLSRLE